MKFHLLAPSKPKRHIKRPYKAKLYDLNDSESFGKRTKERKNNHFSIKRFVFFEMFHMCVDCVSDFIFEFTEILFYCHLPFHWYHNAMHTRTHFSEMHIKTIFTIFFSLFRKWWEIALYIFHKTKFHCCIGEIFHENECKHKTV